METLLKYGHEVVMFFAVSLSMGGTILLFKLVKSDNVSAIRASFGLFRPTINAVAPAYILGTILGLATAWAMGLPLLSFWLVAVYVLSIVAAVIGETTKSWVVRIAGLAEKEQSATPGPELRAALDEKAPRIIRMIDMVFLPVFLLLMVYRPNLW